MSEEFYYLIKILSLWAVGLLCPMAQSDDSHDTLALRDIKQFPQFIRVTHTHDKRVEPPTSLVWPVSVAITVIKEIIIRFIAICHCQRTDHKHDSQ